MNLNATFDVTQFASFLTDLERRQLPFAAMLALNQTAIDAQDAIRGRIQQRGFTIRSAVSAEWLSRQIYFGRENRATKQNLTSRVTLDPIKGGGKNSGRSSLLPFYESGFLRRSNRIIGSDTIFPVGSIAIPNRGRNQLKEIDRSLYPSMLGIQERLGPNGYQKVKIGRGKKARSQFAGLKGKRRTFVVRTGAGTGQVRQRIGSDKRATVLLFRIRPPKFVAPHPFFFEAGQHAAQRTFLPNLRSCFAQAMATAR